MNDKLWYHDGLRFRCTGCGNCCIGAPGYVWVNKAEIEAMAAVLDLPVEPFEKRYVRLVGIRKSLIEFANGDCVFFDGKSRECRIYDARPRQCRIWPFWPSNLRTAKSWDEMCSECPGGNHGPLVPCEKIQSRLKIMNV